MGNRPKPPPLIGASTLDSWLGRSAALPQFEQIQGILPNCELGGWIGIETRCPLHEAESLPAQNLQKSAHEVLDYLYGAMNIIDSEEPGWLDKEEVEMIREGLGPPPPRCLPLYFISVGAGADERLVYVGQTSAAVPRFRTGHSVATRLHAPEYSSLEKHVYLASVMLLTDDPLLKDAGGYLPLEWISPAALAGDFLQGIENALIYELKPTLNRNLKNSYRPKKDVSVSVQNFCEDSDFMNFALVSPRPDERKRSR